MGPKFSIAKWPDDMPETMPHPELLSPRGKRFAEIAMLALGLLAAAPAEAAKPAGAESAWGQLVGKNVEERNLEIAALERECSALERAIAHDASVLARDEFRTHEAKDRIEVLKHQREGELRRKRAAISRLRNGMRKPEQPSLDGAVEGIVLPGMDVSDVESGSGQPMLDFSPEGVPSEVVQSYFATYGVTFADHALRLADASGTTGSIPLGPEFTDADFYLRNANKDLWIVFTKADGSHETLILVEGKFDSVFASDDKGNQPF